MEITCYDKYGRVIEKIVQWDVGQSISIKGYDLTSYAPQIHFANANSEKALVVESVFSGGLLSCQVPNSLARENLPIIMYIYDAVGETGKTNTIIKIPVTPRPMPEDVVYTDDVGVISLTEVLRQAREYMNNSLNYSTKAKGSEEKAKTSADAAKVSETNAAKSESTAFSSAAQAAQSAKEAKAYVGSPLVANTVSTMTDQTKVYVYTGSESGYTAGNWYYHNGSAWVSGGVYNSSAVNVDKTLTQDGYAADAKVTGDAVGSLKEDIYNLPNYSFDKNYAYGIHSNDNFTNGGNNLTVIRGVILPVGKYYIFAKIKIVTHTSDAYVRLYVQQANFNSDLVKIDGSGEYFIEGHFNIERQADSYSSIRIDFNKNDSSRSVDVESLFIVKDSNRIISAIKNDNTDREKVCSFVLEQEYYPINMATKKDIDALKTEFTTDTKPEPLFDFVKDYGNRNYSICLIGDSTSDGKAGPAIGIYTALSQQQKSGELLDGVQVIDRGSNGSTAEAYIGSYSNNSGALYNAIQDNADIYVVCLGINDVRQGLCTKETLKERISFIVNEILSKTKGRVILRTPNSLGNDDVSEQYIKPYTSAQKYTDILWEAYDELKNVWSCTRVRSLDMQTLIFGRKSVPSATNFLMGDVLHPSSSQAAKTTKQNWDYGMNIIGLCIACTIGYKEKPNAFEIFKAKTNNPTNPYIEYPLILESKDYVTKKIYELNQGDVTATYIQFFDVQKETTILKTGDVLRFGNEFCKVYNGERTQNVGTLLHVEMAFSESELEKVKNVFTVSVYRL